MKKPTIKQHTALYEKLLKIQERVDSLNADWEKKTGRESGDDKIGSWLDAVTGDLESAMSAIDEIIEEEVIA
jgi:hypothetical protein